MAIPRQYERLRLLGSGTFGKAWLVREPRDRGLHVLKEIAVATMTPREREQALTEVTVLSRCRHVNIIRYRDAYVSGTSLQIVMEYADGGDLHDRIEQQNGVPFETERVVHWFVQLCLALKYIHSQSILHRDLKARNIFVNSQNVVKLGDFGIARILADNETHAQTAVGTPYYLSPEICNQQPYNQRSDLWSAGCVLYELITFRPPFQASTFPALVLSIVHGHYPPLPRNCGPLLQDLVSILLRVAARDRPSAEQVLAIPALASFVAKYKHRLENVATPSAVKLKGRSHLGDDEALASPTVQRDSPHCAQQARAAPMSSKPRPETTLSKHNIPPTNPCNIASDITAPSEADIKADYHQGSNPQRSAARPGNCSAGSAGFKSPGSENNVHSLSKKGQNVRRFSLRTPPIGGRDRDHTSGVRASRSVDCAKRSAKASPSKHKSPRLVLFREVIARQRARSQSSALRNGGRTYSVSPCRKDSLIDSSTDRCKRLHPTEVEKNNSSGRDPPDLDVNNNDDSSCRSCPPEYHVTHGSLGNTDVKQMRLLLASLDLNSTQGNELLTKRLRDVLGPDEHNKLGTLVESSVTSLVDVMAVHVAPDHKVWLPLLLYQIAREKLIK